MYSYYIELYLPNKNMKSLVGKPHLLSYGRETMEGPDECDLGKVALETFGGTNKPS